MAWSKVEPAQGSAVPSARWRHTLTAISPTKLLLFGGFHSATKRCGDTWLFDIPSRMWAQHLHVGHIGGSLAAAQKAQEEEPETTTNRRAARNSDSDLAPAADPNGDATPPPVPQTPLTDGPSPSKQAAEGGDDIAAQPPPPRGAHSAVLIGDVVYVFGGHGGRFACACNVVKQLLQGCSFRRSTHVCDE